MFYFGLSAQSIVALATKSSSTTAEHLNFQIPFLLVSTSEYKSNLSPGIAGLLNLRSSAPTK
jgi:hypothetical protein